VRVHLLGIGGAGVSSLAQVLQARGDTVSGCDVRPSPVLDRLAAGGIRIAIGHDPAHVEGQDLVVFSGAVRPDAPELGAARAAGRRVLSRAELLAELIDTAPASVAVAGTHGKTTTTSMAGQVLNGSGWSATVLVGDGVSTRVGGDGRLIAEADESDGSLVLHHPDYAIITNIELDHPDHYPDLPSVRTVFERFASQVKEFTVVCADDEEAARLPIPGRRVTYGLEQGDYQPSRLGLELSVPGRHNLLNATAVAALALELGCDLQNVRRNLKEFTGASRRLERVGEWRGAVLYDDYGHHPTEVRATLQAARELLSGGRLLLVFQPHRYSRLAALMDDFAASLSGADEVFITEVYSAGEQDPGNVSGRHLAEKVPRARFVPGSAAVEDGLFSLVRPGDLVLFMGAGDIWKIPHELAQGA